MFTTQSPIYPDTVYPAETDLRLRSHELRPESGYPSHRNGRSTKYDSLKKPAAILIGAAALALALIPTGTFEATEGGAIAAVAGGGAVACWVSDRHHRFSS